mmetsp:Transcript_55967/g.157711  ORF Transcript_55967/g.157711 Transcript_55967/m.157711 type:complete len:339 (+) Transcript_55967:56-1072(+)
MVAAEASPCSMSSTSPTFGELDARQTGPAAGAAAQAAMWWCPEAACHERSPKQTSAWWRLVWCHERCHKQECEPRRKFIGEQAGEAGADMVCLKKAGKFAMWLAQAQRPSFALLTDWREVKPCLQTAAAHRPQNRPAFTIILAELPRHHERASAWAQGLSPRADPVHICQDVGALKMFLADQGSRLLSSSALHSQIQLLPQQVHQKVTCTAHYGHVLADREAGAAAGHGGPTLLVPLVRGAAPQWCGEVQVQAGRATVAMLPARAVQAATCVAAAEGAQRAQEAWSRKLADSPVAQVLSPVCGSQSPVQLAQLLRDAMPDHYDDLSGSAATDAGGFPC